jgi:heptosyltransferase-2
MGLRDGLSLPSERDLARATPGRYRPAVQLLVIKTGALGDVVRTTSILPGLARKHADLALTWLTAHGALDLVRGHRLVERAVGVDPLDADDLARVARELGRTAWGRVFSFDDEEPLCRLATTLCPDAGRLSGAYFAHGARRYTPDVAPWFDMGLLSVHGKAEADRRKLANRKSHPRIFAEMLGIELGEPQLELPAEARAFATRFAARTGLGEPGVRVIGLNTGAGGRWESKRLSEERTVELAAALARALDGRAAFLLCGGPEEGERNARIGRGLDAARLRWIDAGTRNSLLEFAALLARCDLLVTSDSLALHLATTQKVPILAFFAPTPAHEIELYGRGEAVASTAPDYASYRRDADTSTLTVARLLPAALRVLRDTESGTFPSTAT